MPNEGITLDEELNGDVFNRTGMPGSGSYRVGYTLQLTILYHVSHSASGYCTVA
jgi:hypothetical protein